MRTNFALTCTRNYTNLENFFIRLRQIQSPGAIECCLSHWSGPLWRLAPYCPTRTRHRMKPKPERSIIEDLESLLLFFPDHFQQKKHSRRCRHSEALYLWALRNQRDLLCRMREANRMALCKFTQPIIDTHANSRYQDLIEHWPKTIEVKVL